MCLARRDATEEFVGFLRQLLDWLNEKIRDYKNWYNKEVS